MKKQAKGFSLIEVLVSLVIFAVGVLGLTGMYLSALKAQADAKSRSAINLYVSSMMDRIAANPTAAIVNDAYKLDYPTPTPSTAQCVSFKRGDNLQTSLPAFANSLTPTALAAAESAAFAFEVACNLPSGEVDIKSGQVPQEGLAPCVAPLIAAPNMVTIRVRWRDTRSTSQVSGNAGAQFECYAQSMRVQ
jgi:type IV pilus assembly protein PilV